VKDGGGKSPRLPPATAIAPGTEKIYNGDALRLKKVLNPKEGLIQGGNRVEKGSRKREYLSFLSWPSFASLTQKRNAGSLKVSGVPS
jgi:hypothetical protein